MKFFNMMAGRALLVTAAIGGLVIFNTPLAQSQPLIFVQSAAQGVIGGMTAKGPGSSPAERSAAYMAANCANCHGTDGNAQGAGSWPLAGKSKSYLVEQMAAFKAGTRQATIMHQISKGYSDDQIAAMAEYFSKQKPRQ
jgi:cytochrome subunit of sulfide dehydrogenase